MDNYKMDAQAYRQALIDTLSDELLDAAQDGEGYAQDIQLLSIGIKLVRIVGMPIEPLQESIDQIEIENVEHAQDEAMDLTAKYYA